MPHKQKVRVRVPASTANLGPGFDAIGMALPLYLWMDMRMADETRITLHGSELAGLPADESNLIFRSAQILLQAAGVQAPHLDIEVYSEIPLTRGLGSSANAIVAGMVAANALIGSPFGKERILDLATEMEKHPDNVGACLYGGIVVAHWNGTHVHHICLQPDENLELLAIIPDFHLPTDQARNVLPDTVERKDAVNNVGYTSLLVAALATGRLDMLRHAMKDCLHQPYRAALVPGMERILEDGVEHGALGVVLSGAGPTLLAFVDRRQPAGERARLMGFIRDVFREAGVTADVRHLRPDTAGAVVLTDNGAQCTLSEMIAKGVVPS